MATAEQTARLARVMRVLSPRQRRRRKPPRQILPLGLERDYARELLRAVEAIEREFKPVLEAMPFLLASVQKSRARLDIGEGSRLRALFDAVKARLTAATSTSAIDELARKFATQTQTHQRIQLRKQVRSVLGADVLASDQGIASMVDSFAAENVALIKDVPAKIVSDLEKLTTRALASATPHRDFAGEVQDIFRVSRNRARLIARDQIGKLYSQVNEQRQRNMGITEFIWRTASDERVRPEHVVRNGKKYSYDAPPNGELPGLPINCRCYAEPVLDDILGAL